MNGDLRSTAFLLGLAVLMLVPSSQALGDATALLERDDAFQEFMDSMTMEKSLSQLNEKMESHSINHEEWRQFYDNALSSNHQRDEVHSDAESQYQFQILPGGLLYRSYLAGEKEPRMMWSALYDIERKRTVWETALGARVGLLRYGTQDTVRPQGYQLDLEGAVFARLLPGEPSTMLEAADFRFGLLNTWREGWLAAKWGYYHVSAHLGDEFLIANRDFERINYVRDAAIVGLIADLKEDVQVYGEVANAIGYQGGAKPWEFQFGTQYVPLLPRKRFGVLGAPYLGANTYLRQDFNFRAGLNLIAGWNWFGEKTGERFRIGFQYYRGPSLQYSFHGQNERLVGGGVWFDY